MRFRCKYCGNEMTDSIIEFNSNKYCNSCLNERIDNLSERNKLKDGKFILYGVEIDLNDNESKNGYHFLENLS